MSGSAAATAVEAGAVVADVDAVAERLGDVLLRDERVGRAERDVGPALAQREDEVRRLGGDVQAGADADAGERALAGEARADRAQDGHLPARPLDPAAGEPGLSSGNGPACTGRRPATPMYAACSGVSLVSDAPSASTCTRATFSSRCFGST